jgi:hypothetical protein
MILNQANSTRSERYLIPAGKLAGFSFEPSAAMCGMTQYWFNELELPNGGCLGLSCCPG